MTLWVFGYGSLIWNPGFDVEERIIATLHGYSRSFCMKSIHHRGTPQDPGLVLALDENTETFCEGLALRVPDQQTTATLHYLRERELVSSAYLEKTLPVHLADGRQVQAVSYVIDADHTQYCGSLDLEEQAQIIANATGGRGPNTEYLFNTAEHLQELGIVDNNLNWLSERVRSIVQ
ncbi:gamma-glutamylcyclotransferase [Parasulfitobacter algicola]|uniref:glutathione-specific gamma-glutamylcyclotransferase n=1 Tax=Parasulfitobacter algicola TaxID=2614809 RepID=A0ABX2IWS6_9RHOB|nr:gamma-glutamylcyclotransferase [Sulfitobacter algicola]NSX54831.1 gamma-glutamylcyclotransferase [Sulfitobacter algicola]